MSVATALRPAVRRAPIEAEPHLTLVRDEPRTGSARRSNRVVLGAVAVIGALGLLFVLAVLQTAITQGQAHLDRVEAQAAEREAEARALEFEVAQLEAPSRIIAEAEARLGLVEPDQVHYVEPVDPSAAPATPAAPAAPAAPDESAPVPAPAPTTPDEVAAPAPATPVP